MIREALLECGADRRLLNNLSLNRDTENAAILAAVQSDSCLIAIIGIGHLER